MNKMTRWQTSSRSRKQLIQISTKRGLQEKIILKGAWSTFRQRESFNRSHDKESKSLSCPEDAGILVPAS